MQNKMMRWMSKFWVVASGPLTWTIAPHTSAQIAIRQWMPVDMRAHRLAFKAQGDEA